MPYSYAVYSVQDQHRTVATNEKIAAMEADGWRPHTVACNFAELCIFWEKAAPAKKADGAADRKAASREEDREKDKTGGKFDSPGSA